MRLTHRDQHTRSRASSYLERQRLRVVASRQRAAHAHIVTTRHITSHRDALTVDDCAAATLHCRSRRTARTPRRRAPLQPAQTSASAIASHHIFPPHARTPYLCTVPCLVDSELPAEHVAALDRRWHSSSGQRLLCARARPITPHAQCIDAPDADGSSSVRAAACARR
jgi:hypothetical protein